MKIPVQVEIAPQHIASTKSKNLEFVDTMLGRHACYRHIEEHNRSLRVPDP